VQAMDLIQDNAQNQDIRRRKSQLENRPVTAFSKKNKQ